MIFGRFGAEKGCSRRQSLGNDLSKMHVSVMRPRLPTAEQLLPYLRRIDAARIYSNWGPLVTEFEQRLAQLLGVTTGCVVSASSGTIALVGSIFAAVETASTKKPYA